MKWHTVEATVVVVEEDEENQRKENRVEERSARVEEGEKNAKLIL